MTNKREQAAGKLHDSAHQQQQRRCTCRRPLVTQFSCVGFVTVLVFVITVRQIQHGYIYSSVKSERDLALGTTTTDSSERSPMYPPQQHNSTATSSSLETSKVTVIVQLSGEFGNHLGKLAAGLGVAMELHSRYNVTAELKLRHQEGTTKWVPVVPDMKRCVPSTLHLNFSEAQDFNPSASSNSIFDGINSDHAESVQGSIRAAAEQAYKGDNKLTLYSNHITMWDSYMDLYYDQFRNFFRFDDACCRKRAFPNETAFHYRQFNTEMPLRGSKLGYEEITPTDLLNQIFIPYNVTSIAILSRFKNAHLDDYAETLRRAGVSVRLITDQTGMEDFCFLKSVKRNIIGSARSTFFGWAAILSDSAVVTAYSIDSPTQREWAEGNGLPLRQHHNWTNPKLSERVFFPLIKSTRSLNETDDSKV